MTDPVHQSKTRAAIDGGKSKLFGSGKAAFRFLIPRKVALEDPVTRPLVEKLNSLYIWFQGDRRIVMYPCNDNETLNFVLIHPDTESHATRCDGEPPPPYPVSSYLLTAGPEWNKQGTLDQVLKVYQDFDPALKQLLSKLDPTDLKVWQLMDMDKLPTWTKEKLALIGDAAHPFTPRKFLAQTTRATNSLLTRVQTRDRVPDRLLRMPALSPLFCRWGPPPATCPNV